ncbi:MAG: YqcC family protein [Pseudomonadota bacterium]
MSRETQLAVLLIDIEAQLRQLGDWDSESPSATALASEQPFCVDTLSLPQWLQFVLLPRLCRMLKAGDELPSRCGIAPMAEEYYRGRSLACKELLNTLARVDELLSVR